MAIGRDDRDSRTIAARGRPHAATDGGGSARRCPLVSVVMPVKNEASHIATSLGSVLAQDYPPDKTEVVVVDGCSSDNTASVVENLAARAAARGGPKVRLLTNDKGTVPASLNLALNDVRGEVIVRVDGHCRLAPDYIRRCVEVLDETRADNVGGLQVPEGRRLVGRAIAVATTSRFGVGGARFHYSARPGWVDTVYLGAYKRDVFERFGTFDEDLTRNQDDEFNFRLTQGGGRIWLDPSIRSVYFPRERLADLARQYFQYGLYKVRVIQKRRGLPSLRLLIPPLFVLAALSSAVASIARRRVAPTAGVVAPYAVANLSAAVLAGRRDPMTLPLLPVVFAVMHVAYGTGFLSGLWRLRRGPEPR